MATSSRVCTLGLSVLLKACILNTYRVCSMLLSCYRIGVDGPFAFLVGRENHLMLTVGASPGGEAKGSELSVTTVRHIFASRFGAGLKQTRAYRGLGSPLEAHLLHSYCAVCPCHSSNRCFLLKCLKSNCSYNNISARTFVLNKRGYWLYCALHRVGMFGTDTDH